MRKACLYSCFVIFFFTSFGDIEAGDFWEKCNGPFGGTFDCINIDSAGSIYVGEYSLFRSEDNGENWKKIQLFTPQDSIRVENIITSGNNIFLNTTIFNKKYGYGSSKIIHSKDQGRTWTIREDIGYFDSYIINKNGDVFFANSNEFFFYDALIDSALLVGVFPSKDVYVTALAIAQNGNIIASSNSRMRGILLSSDTGRTWKLVDDLSVVTSFIVCNSGKIIAGTTEKGILESEDNGNTWQQASYKTHRIEYYLKDSIGNIYAITDYKELMLTTDEGKTWNNLSSSIRNVRCIVVNKYNEVFAAVEFAGIMKSVDFGITWTEKNIGLRNLPVLNLCKAKDILLAGTNGRGLLKSTDEGKSWVQIFQDVKDYYNEIYSTEILNNGNYISGSQSGVFLSQDDGKTWNPVVMRDYAGFQPEMKFQKSGSRDVYMLEYYSGLLKSTNFGWDWFYMPSNLRGSKSFYISRKGFMFSPYYSYRPESSPSLFWSSDDGNSWNYFDFEKPTQIYAIAENSNGLLLCLTRLGIYQSVNDGVNWKKISDKDYKVLSLSSDSLGNFYAGTKGNGILTSSDNGFTWTDQNSGLENYYVNSILCDTDGTLYTATSGGIYKSTTFTGIKEIPFLTGTDDELTISPKIIENYSIITYSVTSEVQIRLNIVNSLGMEVAVLDEGFKVAGSYNYNLAVSDLNLQTGLYFINLISGSKNWTEKIFVLRN